jgi:hypothetical protein
MVPAIVGDVRFVAHQDHTVRVGVANGLAEWSLAALVAVPVREAVSQSGATL